MKAPPEQRPSSASSNYGVFKKIEPTTHQINEILILSGLIPTTTSKTNSQQHNHQIDDSALLSELLQPPPNQGPPPRRLLRQPATTTTTNLHMKTELGNLPTLIHPSLMMTKWMYVGR
jgi:hypothetical protein